MRRLLYLAALAMLTTLVLASAAMAQTRGPSGADGTYNCADFDDQGQAQEFSLSDPGDTNGLDEDGDGRVCESLPTAVPGGEDGPDFVPGPGESTPTPTQPSQQPMMEETMMMEQPKMEQPKTESTTPKDLPNTGGTATGPAFLLPAGALLVGSGLLALGILRRRR